MARVTAFVTTVGAPTFDDCMRSLRTCHGRFIISVVRDVKPFAAAANEMLRRCTTELFVQVDEDMILWPHAIAELVKLIDSKPAACAMATAPLWDVETDMPIYGIKVYRHALLRDIPFENHVLGDKHDRDVWAARGLTVERADRTRENCLGKHGTFYTPEQAFNRWRGLFQRHRRSPTAWVEPWLLKLAERYRRSGSRRDLYASLGAFIGATEDLWPEGAGPDAGAPNCVLERLLALVDEPRTER